MNNYNLANKFNQIASLNMNTDMNGYYTSQDHEGMLGDILMDASNAVSTMD